MTASITSITRRPVTRAQRLTDLTLRTAVHAEISPDPVLAGLVAELAAEVRLLARSVSPEDQR